MNCYCPNRICRIYNDIQFLILFSLLPSIIMLSFSCQTIRNIKQIHQQIRSITTQHRLIEKKDYQMMLMLFVQVIFFFICVTPSAISKTYSTLTLTQSKNILELTNEYFFFQLSVLII